MKRWIFALVSACAARFKRVEPRLAVFRGVAALLLAAFALNLQPAPDKDAPFTPIPARFSFAAQAERLCFARDCPCYDEPYRTKCFAEEKAGFERAYPPRGQIEGVCWAFRYKSEKDPATGELVRRTDQTIYASVRFNETEVLYPNHKGSFESEVGNAWASFVSINNAPSDGWQWSPRCASLNSPRNSEAEQWKKAQEQASYKRVFLPAYSVAEAPEPRDAERSADNIRQEREIERQREEKARRDAAAAADAAAVRDLNAKLGREQQARTGEILKAKEDHRAAVAKHQADAAAIEAANQAQQADYARRKAEADAAQRAYQAALLAQSPRSKPKAPRQCTMRNISTPVSFTASTQESARAGLRGGCNIGGSETVKSMTLGAMSCSQRNTLQLKPPPVGKCLSCIDEKMAINLYGYVPGRGYPAPKVEWVCKATAQCVAEKCGSGEGSKVSTQ